MLCIRPSTTGPFNWLCSHSTQSFLAVFRHWPASTRINIIAQKLGNWVRVLGHAGWDCTACNLSLSLKESKSVRKGLIIVWAWRQAWAASRGGIGWSKIVLAHARLAYSSLRVELLAGLLAMVPLMYSLQCVGLADPLTKVPLMYFLHSVGGGSKSTGTDVQTRGSSIHLHRLMNLIFTGTDSWMSSLPVQARAS